MRQTWPPTTSGNEMVTSASAAGPRQRVRKSLSHSSYRSTSGAFHVLEIVGQAKNFTWSSTPITSAPPVR